MVRELICRFSIASTIHFMQYQVDVTFFLTHLQFVYAFFVTSEYIFWSHKPNSRK